MLSLFDYPLDASDRQAIIDYGDARDRGDREAATRAIRKIKGDPVTLRVLKERLGADHIRRMGFNTELADKEFGAGWLDRDA